MESKQSIAHRAKWINSDIRKQTELNQKFDFVLSCPPYEGKKFRIKMSKIRLKFLDKEVYSKKQEDLSNMDHDTFMREYEKVYNLWLVMFLN